MIIAGILSCLYIKRGHQESESKPKDGRRYSQHIKLMKHACLSFRDFTKNIGGVCARAQVSSGGACAGPRANFPAPQQASPRSWSHMESACMQVSLGKDGGGGGRTLPKTSTFKNAFSVIAALCQAQPGGNFMLGSLSRR